MIQGQWPTEGKKSTFHQGLLFGFYSWQDLGLYQQREWSDFIVIIDAIAGLNAAFAISVVLIDEPLFIGLL